MHGALNPENQSRQKSPELERPAMRLVSEIMAIKPNDAVIITGDRLSDMRVISATASAASQVGAEPIILIHPTLNFPCKELPTAVGRALALADVWIEFAENYTLYSKTWEEAIGRECRYICLAGMCSDMMIRLIGEIETRLLQTLAVKLHCISQNAKSVRITSAGGTDMRVDVNPIISRFDDFDSTSVPRIQMLWGQAGFNTLSDTFEGTLVFDGALWPPQSVGVLQSPVRIVVSSGVIREISGGVEAVTLREWLSSFGHKAMLKVDHVCYGFHPRMMQPSGCILADERIFGCVEFGIGRMDENAPSHCDGIVLNPSVWVDDAEIERNGVYVTPEVVALCRQLAVPAY